MTTDIYQVNYSYNNIKNCSYIFFTYGTPDRFDGSGDKNIRINLCDISSNIDKETISQEALYLLGSIRHSGNKIRTGYKIPKKGDIEKLGGVFAKAKVSPEMQLTIEERNWCRSATLPSGEWDYSTASSQWHIDKAKLLGLDKNCRNRIRGQTETPLSNKNKEAEKLMELSTKYLAVDLESLDIINLKSLDLCVINKFRKSEMIESEIETRGLRCSNILRINN